MLRHAAGQTKIEREPSTFKVRRTASDMPQPEHESEAIVTHGFYDKFYARKGNISYEIYHSAALVRRYPACATVRDKPFGIHRAEVAASRNILGRQLQPYPD